MATGVVDLRRDPRIDMMNAQAIGSIFAAIGRAETLRKKRQDIDTLMKQVASGASVSDAVNAVRSSETTYDSGLSGIWQQLGNAISLGKRPDVTEDLTEAILANQLKREVQLQDPMYQAELEAKRTNTAGAKQRQTQEAELFPSERTIAENRAGVSSLEAAAAPTRIENELASQSASLTSQGLNNQAKQMQIDFDTAVNPIKQRMAELGLTVAGEDIERERELFARGRILEDLKVRGILSDQQYEAEMRPLQLEAQRQTNAYRKAMMDYTARRGTGITPDQEASIIKGLSTAIINAEITDETIDGWESLANTAGKTLKQTPDGGYQIAPMTQNIQGSQTAPNLFEPDTVGTEGDYSKFSDEDLLKSLLSAPAPSSAGDGNAPISKNLEGVGLGWGVGLNGGNLFVPSNVQQTYTKGVRLPFDKGFTGQTRQGAKIPGDPGYEEWKASQSENTGVAGTKYKGYGPQGEAGGIVGPFPKHNQPGGIIGTGDPMVDEFLKTREGQETLKKYGGYMFMTDREKEEYRRKEGKRRLIGMLQAQNS